MVFSHIPLVMSTPDTPDTLNESANSNSQNTAVLSSWSRAVLNTTTMDYNYNA